MKIVSTKITSEAISTSSRHSHEVTGLGIIAALLVGFAGLVTDGSLPLNQYLVFAAFLLVSSCGLTWRMVTPAPARTLTWGKR